IAGLVRRSRPPAGLGQHASDWRTEGGLGKRICKPGGGPVSAPAENQAVSCARGVGAGGLESAAWVWGGKDRGDGDRVLAEFARSVPRDSLLDIPPMPRAMIGAGLYERVGVEAREMEFRRALVVSTGLQGTGIVDEVAGLLARAGVEPIVYDRVESNPKDT